MPATGDTGERDNHVTLAQACCCRRASALDRRDTRMPDATARACARAIARGTGHVLAGDADVAAPDPPVANQLRRDESRRVARDGERQSLRRLNHRRVDADHFALRRHERPAGIAGIQRRIGLQHVVHQTARPARSERPSALTTPLVTEC